MSKDRKNIYYRSDRESIRTIREMRKKEKTIHYRTDCVYN